MGDSGAVTFPHSDEFVRAARAEADALRLEVERLRQEAARHRELAERATAQALQLERRARDLDELLGRAPQLRLDLQSEALRGQRLREAAVETLARRRGLGEPIHYREWFQLLVAEGHEIDGKDPLATFLTQVTRSPVIRRQPDEPGVYRIDVEAGSEAALRELDEAQAELAALRHALAQARERAHEAAIEDVRRRLGRAERRAAAAERALAEVARMQTSLRAPAA